jgi:hypothetical protein
MNNNQTNVEVNNENLVKAAIQKAGGVSAVARLITKKMERIIHINQFNLGFLKTVSLLNIFPLFQKLQE